MKTRLFQGFCILSVLAFCGCASTVRTSPTYEAAIKEVKTIAVMPPDIKVYKETAGGVTELIDEWSEEGKKYVREALEKHLAGRFGFEIKFIEEDFLKQNHREAWNDNRAMYHAVASSALLHTFDPAHTFPTKRKNFDYTLGEEVQRLTEITRTDMLLFIYGEDYQMTAGRTAMMVWYTVLFGAVPPAAPSGMLMGLVNGKTGNLEWLKISPPSQYNFRSPKHMDVLVEWLTRDLVRKE